MRVAFGEYQLDTETRTLHREGRRIPVEPKVFDFLAYLIERRERVVSSNELLDALWTGLHVTPAALSTAVQKARQAVGDDGEHQTVLHTEHGKGFRFIAVVADLSEPETVQPNPASFRTRIAAVAGITALLLVVALLWLSQRQTTDRIPGHSLAVLPFVNMSADADQEYFADGISEELLNTLAQFENLRVVGRTSSFSFKNSDADLKEIGEALNADVILEGSVRTAGDQVRITAQLNGAKDGFHLWSETYDRELTDIFTIQTEIATAIADALRVSLSSEEREWLATPPTENVEAYEAYLFGKQRFWELTAVALAEAVDYFQRAIELDPDFSLAYVALADTYLYQIGWSGRAQAEMIAKAEPLIAKALELDDRLGEAYATLALIQKERADFEGAEATYQRAMELNPNNSMTYFQYGGLMRMLGRPEEALTLHRRGVELDPLAAVMINQVGQDLAALGRYDEGLSWYEKSFDTDPGFSFNLWSIGLHHWLISGEYGEAVRWLREAISADPGDPFNLAHLGRLFMDLGDSDQAEHWIHRSIELAPESFVSNQAMLLLHLYRSGPTSGLDYGRKVLAIDQYFALQVFTVQLIGNYELRAGRYPEARALYEKRHPELLSGDDPRVDSWNYRVAIDLASVLSNTGEQERSNLLLNRSFQHTQTLPRLGWIGYGIADVKIHALRGDKQKALSALRQAIDEGWRSFWWYLLKQDPTLESLHDEPEYQSMVAEIEADMAEQLARVREMERNGELAPIPEISATTR